MLIVSATAYSQCLNFLGQKMVSRLEIIWHSTDVSSNFQWKETIDFTYDDNRALIGLVCVNKPLNYNGETKRFEIRRKGNTLVRTDYVDGKVDKNYSYRYKMMNNCWITRIERYCHAMDGSNECLRDDYDLEYHIQSTQDGVRLKSMTETTYVRLAGNKTFLKCEGLSKFVHLYRYENGNCDEGGIHVWPKGDISEYPFREDKYTYDNVENDTNMNWNALIHNYAFWHDYEFFTEWTALRSSHHLIAVRQTCSDYYDLEYLRDEKGNLNKINMYRLEKHLLYKEVYIKYVEDK